MEENNRLLTDEVNNLEEKLDSYKKDITTKDKQIDNLKDSNRNIQSQLDAMQTSANKKPTETVSKQIEALKIAKVTDTSKCYHVGSSIPLDITGAAAAGWNPLRSNEWFDEEFPDWRDSDTEENAEEGALRRQKLMHWGRKDTVTNLEWIELWGTDDILTLFGFPPDESKPIPTTYIRGYLDD